MMDQLPSLMMSEDVQGEESSPDMFSKLPDSVISAILSFLPVKDSARTSVLSRRWRHLWAVSPISFNPCGYATPSVADRVLSTHAGQVVQAGLSRLLHEDHFDRWLHAVLRRGVQDLSLFLSLSLSSDPRNRAFPVDVYGCNSLQCLSVFYGSFLRTSVPRHAGLFVSLRQLTIAGSDLRLEMVEEMLSRCTALECMALLWPFFWGQGTTLHVRSRSLRCFSLNLPRSSRVAALCIDDAPNLERLALSEEGKPDLRVEVLNAPKLEFVGFLFHLEATPANTNLLEVQSDLQFQFVSV